MIRLNKYLSICGVTSRRGADGLITSGRVAVNGSTVEQLGTIIDEENDTVEVDGVPVSPVEKQVYVVLNKPPGVMTTLSDPFQRKTVTHYLADLDARVYPVGRLDYDTEGVLLLTNDGDLAFRLAHPRYRVEKIYEARVKGKFTEESVQAIGRGITLADGATGKATVNILSYQKGVSKVRLVLTEGRKREVKQLCAAVGHPVVKLVRKKFAGISAKGLQPGKWRHLTEKEVGVLRDLVGL
ncbi:MAG: rRNA pseudouridine synthase [Candidatus Zixiibacteriota bacterium]|nr:MAG: rRNA pseudouridine synthase [candidate division Zixibacteria bacterium]